MRNRTAVLALMLPVGALAAGALALTVLRQGAPPRAPQQQAETAETAPDGAAPPEASAAQAQAAPDIVLPDATPPGEYAFVEEAIPPAIAILLVPVMGVAPEALTDTWGDARAEGRTHTALDIPAPRGTPVIAADSGTILKFFDSEAGGTTIYQRDSTGDYVFYYAHLDRRAPGLAEGGAVKAGQIVGYVGSTGNAAEDAPHLHFEINIAPADGAWYGGEPINPYDVLGRN